MCVCEREKKNVCHIFVSLTNTLYRWMKHVCFLNVFFFLLGKSVKNKFFFSMTA
jgi:hypothetical protein